MSVALLAGFILAYPMNWWLVANHLKHGMMTVRPAPAQAAAAMVGHDAHAGMHHPGQSASHGAMGAPMPAERVAPVPAVPVMAIVSFAALAAGLVITRLAAPM
jgi:hypothetical protein